MPAITVVSDSETGACNIGLPCCPHTRNGTNSVGSPTVFVNGKAVHRVGDTGNCNCPHGGTYVSTTGSSTVFIEGVAVSRIGDTTVCQNCGQSGAHVTGSPNVTAN